MGERLSALLDPVFYPDANGVPMPIKPRDAIIFDWCWPLPGDDSPPLAGDHNRKAAMTAEQRRLRDALDRAERSASWLARRVGVSPMTISRWLGRAEGDQGTRVPEDKRAAVAEALDTTVRDLFTERKKAA